MAKVIRRESENDNKKKILWGCLGCSGFSLIIFIIMIVAGVFSSTSNLNSSGVTLDQYKSLQLGMSEQKVVEMIGTGNEISRNEIAGYITSMYEWEGKGSLGANMNLMFQNGILIQKSQFGLE